MLSGACDRCSALSANQAAQRQKVKSPDGQSGLLVFFRVSRGSMPCGFPLPPDGSKRLAWSFGLLAAAAVFPFTNAAEFFTKRSYWRLAPLPFTGRGW